jgi:hypothetical protein
VEFHNRKLEEIITRLVIQSNLLQQEEPDRADRCRNASEMVYNACRELMSASFALAEF